MYCKYCGSKIENDSVFCSVCGKKLAANEIVPDKKMPSLIQKLAKPKAIIKVNVKKLNKKKIIAIVLIILLVPLGLYISNKPPKNVRSSVYKQAVQYTNHFTELSSKNFPSIPNQEIHDITNFIVENKSNATDEEMKICDDLLSLMVSYGFVSSVNNTSESVAEFNSHLSNMKKDLKMR